MMKKVLKDSNGQILAVCGVLHCDQKVACGSFSSFHQTLTDHGTFDIQNADIVTPII
jgi:hypothetical protein